MVRGTAPISGDTSTSLYNMVDNIYATNATSYLTTPTYDGSGQVVHPSIVYDADGWNGHKYWMAITPYPAANAALENPSILVSNDGVAWEVPEGLTNPLARPPSDGFNADPCLFMGNDEKMWLFWRGYVPGTHTATIWARHSTDGITWSSKESIIVSTTEGLACPTVVVDASGYTMWTTLATTHPYMLNKRTCATPNGTWSGATTCNMNMPAGFDIWHVEVRKVGYEYYAIIDVTAGRLYFSTSKDGEVWKSGAKHFLNRIGTTGWDSNALYKATSLYVENGDEPFIRLWYGGIKQVSPTVTEWHIGYTEAKFNPPPVATAQSVTTAEDTAKAITLAGTDVDGNSLTYIVVTQPAHGILSGTVPMLSYAPALNYNGVDSFTFKVNDGLLNSNIATVSIIITAVNDAPVATAQSVTTAEDTAKAVTLAGTDVDGNSLTYTVLTHPEHGILTGIAPNMSYTPALNYNGVDSFTFTVHDGLLNSNIAATVSITIIATNDAPVATAQGVTTAEDTAKAIKLAGTDIDGNALTYIVVTQPAHGKLTGTAPILSYSPALNYNGADSFTFKVNDGLLNSNIATVSIIITAVNDAPVATAQSVTIAENIAKAIKLAGSDVDGNALTYIVLTQPAYGILSGIVPMLTYTPNHGYIGADSFTFKVNDGIVDSAGVTVSITIAKPLSSVTFIPKYASPQLTAQPITLKASVIGGANLQYQFLVNGMVVREYAVTNTYDWKPILAGTYSLVVKAKDLNKMVTSAVLLYKIMPQLTVVTSLLPPRPIKTSISFTANAQGITTPHYSFRISYKDRWGRTINSIQTAYGQSNTLVWKPLVAAPYTVTVLARESASTTAYDATKSITYAITAY